MTKLEQVLRFIEADPTNGKTFTEIQRFYWGLSHRPEDFDRRERVFPRVQQHLDHGPTCLDCGRKIVQIQRASDPSSHEPTCRFLTREGPRASRGWGCTNLIYCPQFEWERLGILHVFCEKGMDGRWRVVRPIGPPFKRTFRRLRVDFPGGF